MEKYYEERFKALRSISKKLASIVEVNRILEILREEARELIPPSIEACILLLDPEAQKYTRPLQCALYDRPVNCLSCKRNRSTVQKAMERRKGMVLSKTEQIIRRDGSRVETGPEIAMPVFVKDEILAVISVLTRPGTKFTRKDFFFTKDLAEMVGNAIINSKIHWEITQEKIKISKKISNLLPFVPHSVRQLVENNPEMLKRKKEEKEVTVLFLDLEGYTKLSSTRPETDVNEMVEKMFSSFVDPIHRSGGDINETAGDGLMIIFKNDDARTNAINAVRTAFDIDEMSRKLNKRFSEDFEPVAVNIGINSGKALVGMTQFKGSLETRMTYTASGQVTNLAARLADLAKGGDILIGEETGKMVKGLWPVYDRGRVRLKGVGRPLTIYSLKQENG
ncbi:MAG: GAF domain-containing protein [Desulfobacterales bacterium]|nr:GAF domain-containing protein [Desulfobacterales bacterium]